MKLIQARVNDSEAAEVKMVLESYGLDIPTAIRMYFSHIARTKKAPVSFNFMESETNELDQIYEEAKAGKNVSETFSSAEDAINFLESL